MSAPSTHRIRPVISSAYMETMNAYTGIANAAPDSRMPRRFSAHTTAMMPSENHTGWSATMLIAEPMFATPAAVDTATVRM